MIEREYKEIDFDTLKNEDKFERYKYLTQLEHLIRTKKDDSFVLEISGQYGSGKTFFVNLLDKYLKKQGYQTLYYNAWEHDYAQDAFISFCSMFVSHFDASSPDKKGFKSVTKKMIFAHLPELLSFVCKAILKVDIRDAIDLVCEGAQTIDENSKQTQKACNNLLDIELERENIIAEFRTELEKSVQQENKEKPLVVFIDDLDRCKADFTIRLLDYIKHLFNIKGITFVLAVDDEQLKSTVEHFYGLSNASGYLKRIVDFEFKLPVANYKQYIITLLAEYAFPDYSHNDFFVNLLNNLGFIFNLSLRDIRNVFDQVHKTMKDKENYIKYPYMYFVVYIMDHHFAKYKDEVLALETEKSKSLSNSKKLVGLFNYKFALSPYYTNSLLFDVPLDNNSKREFSLQDMMIKLTEVRKVDEQIPCYSMFPPHIAYSKTYDPYGKLTIYERIMIDMDEARKESDNQI